MLKQFSYLNNTPERPHIAQCSKTWTTVMGLPCSHLIKERLSTPPGILKIEDIHPHWRFVKPSIEDRTPPSPSVIDPLLQVQEPTMARARGRPAGSSIQPPTQAQLAEEASTQRMPSEFERVEANIGGQPLAQAQRASVRGRVNTRRPRGRPRGSRGGRGGRGAGARPADNILDG